jgi:hypothetical protein
MGKEDGQSFGSSKILFGRLLPRISISVFAIRAGNPCFVLKTRNKASVTVPSFPPNDSPKQIS